MELGKDFLTDLDLVSAGAVGGGRCALRFTGFDFDGVLWLYWFPYVWLRGFLYTYSRGAWGFTDFDFTEVTLGWLWFRLRLWLLYA